jgi:hypothetical protein
MTALGEVTASLAPFCQGTTGRGCMLRTVPINDGFLIGMAVPGHGDIRGGVVTAAELLQLGKQLMDLAIGHIRHDWQSVQQFAVSADRVK